MIVYIVDQIEVFLEAINFLGFEMDKWILVLYLHLCVPLGFVFQKIQSPNARALYNLAIGLFFAMIISKEWFVFINAVAVLIYIVANQFKKCVLPVFILSFAIMSYIHIYRQINDYLSWKLDYNAVQMMITARYIYYAVDRQDHQAKESFLLYYSYIFMFPNLIIAPVPFRSFVNLVSRSEDLSGWSHRDALTSLLKALLFSAGEIVLRPHFDIDWYWSDQWAQLSVLERTLFNMVICVVQRFQYYAAFKYAQAAMDAMGITYNPATKRCDRFSVADYHFELEKNVVKRTEMWNTNVQYWLKYCFYDRLSPVYGAKTFYIVFLISCLWHGFYLSYYLFFTFWAMSVQVCKYFYKAQSRFYFLPETVRHGIAWFFVSHWINNFALGQRILDWELGMKFNNSFYWWPQVLCVVCFVFFNVTQFGQKGPRPAKQKSP